MQMTVVFKIIALSKIAKTHTISFLRPLEQSSIDGVALILGNFSQI